MGALAQLSLGVGTWAWGERRVWDYGHGYGEADLQAAFQASLRHGVSFFDSAEIYGSGESERILGRCLSKHAGAVTVATKFMPYPWRWRRGALLRSLRASLSRLSLSRVDLYQLHAPLPFRSVRVWCEELAEAVRLGLAGEVGVSNLNREQMLRAADVLAGRGVRLASNQVRFSLLHREHEQDGLLEACRQNDIRFIAYSPLAMGWLGGRYDGGHPLPWPRRLFARTAWTRVRPVLAALERLGQAHAKTPAQVALRWAIQKGSLPIPGAKNAAQAEANAGALGWNLSPAEMAELDGAGRVQEK